MDDHYNVVWDRASKDSSGSMPLGNGDIGLNVWVEEGGDLRFYISKTDAWSDAVRLLKLGRICIRLTPNPFKNRVPFKQTLRLGQGEIDICAGGDGSEVTLRIWVDASRPVIHIEATSKMDFDIQCSLELWRTRIRELPEGELSSSASIKNGCPHPVFEYPDTILSEEKDRIIWFHRNERSDWEETLKFQGLESMIGKLPDPLMHRTLGGLIEGTGLARETKTTLKSAESKKQYNISIYVLTKQTKTAEEWVKELEQEIELIEKVDLGKSYADHLSSWDDFWKRSFIRVSGLREAEIVSQRYALQRFITACAGRGAFPIKFNGSIFTVDARIQDKTFNADYRKWGGNYWFQNTRLIYWTMLAPGDFDLMKPLFRMYLEALPLARERTRLYFNHEGAFFPETMSLWGTYQNDNYGWDREGHDQSYVVNRYIRYYYSGALELIAMMLDYYSYTEDVDFIKSTLLPFAEEIIRFYDLHYQRDDKGKIRFSPAQSIEMWWDVVNPMPEVAGLHFVLDKLLNLPSSIIDDGLHTVWQRLRGELPSVPMKTEDGETVLLAAEKITGESHNYENPELYAVFPYRLYGVGKPDLETGRLSFERRLIKEHHGWTQDAIQAAYLGLTDQARELTVMLFSTHHDGSRFPAFWGPNHDWIPDQDHGNVAVKALQTMLMHTEGEKIILFPSWPKDWDVEFKLHAPMNTTVEGVYREGRLEKLVVTPESRKKDVVKIPR